MDIYRLFTKTIDIYLLPVFRSRTIALLTPTQYLRKTRKPYGYEGYRHCYEESREVVLMKSHV